MAQITYTASELVYAENLLVNSCINNTLTASWSSPAQKTIESWTVRCYNSNYNETIITSETTAVFQNLNHAESFTVEVIAAGMSVSQRVYVPENSVTVTNLKSDSVDCTGISLSWNTSQKVPENGWILQYQIKGTDLKAFVACKDNNARITPVIPGCTYLISLQDSNANSLLGGLISCTVPETTDFSGTYGSRNVSRENLSFRMCKTPSKTNWTYKNVRSSDYTDQFSVGQNASFVVHISTSYKSDNSNVDISYVICDANDNPISIASQTFTWTQMWNKSYCELDIPNMPDAAGSYTISVYFNGLLAHEQDFTVTA